MDSYRGGDLVITVIEVAEPPRIFLSWEGRGNERDPRATLGTFLRAVVDHAAQRGAAVELHCQRVSSVNSATIGCLVDLIRTSTTASVKLTLRYDAATTWQRFTFEALGVLAKGDGRFVLEKV